MCGQLITPGNPDLLRSESGKTLKRGPGCRNRIHSCVWSERELIFEDIPSTKSVEVLWASRPYYERTVYVLV